MLVKVKNLFLRINYLKSKYHGYNLKIKISSDYLKVSIVKRKV